MDRPRPSGGSRRRASRRLGVGTFRRTPARQRDPRAGARRRPGRGSIRRAGEARLPPSRASRRVSRRPHRAADVRSGDGRRARLRRTFAGRPRSAGYLWGLAQRPPGPVDVTGPGCEQPRRGSVLTALPSTPADVTRCRGVPVTHPARTLLDMALRDRADEPRTCRRRGSTPRARDPRGLKAEDRKRQRPALGPCERSSSSRRAPPSPARKRSGACSPSSAPQDFPRPSTTSVSTGARSTCSGASRALSSRSTASRSTRPVRHSNATGCETPASLERASG